VAAGAAEVVLITAAFLVALGRALGSRSNPGRARRSSEGVVGARCRSIAQADPQEQPGSPARPADWVSKRPIWLAEAAPPIGARPPTTQRRRRIAAHPLGVVHALVAGQPAEYRLPQ